MVKKNPAFEQLESSYIFPFVEAKLAETEGDVINLGVGDIARPLAPPILAALSAAVSEMGRRPVGYGPSEGYPFLRKAICAKEYEPFGLSPDHIFITDGINSDIAHFLQLFDRDIAVGIPTPSYPAYLDATLLARKAHIVPIVGTFENHFLPLPDGLPPLDLIYLCSPGNPAGMAYTKEQLKLWVDKAHRDGAIILFDAAYDAFIQDPDVPKTIYEIDGAREVAIEMKSFSKSYGFTGLRCSHSVVPMEPWRTLWLRRVSSHTNGVAYPIQRAAECALTLEPQDVNHYLNEAQILREALTDLGQTHFGGVNAPYIFWKTPDGLDDRAFFEHLLKEAGLLTIPGSGFGPEGEGFVRLSSFTNRASDAAKRLKEILCPI